MAGLLYLPRLFVYHSEARKDSILYETFLLMEKRLIRIIMLPSMLVTICVGLYMIYLNDIVVIEIYFQLKLFLLVILFGFHGYLVSLFKKFEQKQNLKSPKFFRVINEIPTVIMIIIIILVVVKPNL